MMPSVYFYLLATIMLSLNLVRLAGLAISDWLYFIALGLTFLETLIYEQKNFRCWTKNPLIWPTSLILFGAVLSASRTTDIQVALIEVFQQVYVITVFVSLTWIMFRRGYGDWTIKAFIFSGLFTAIVALTDYLTGSNFGPILSGTPNAQLWYRYAGTLGHPNKFGYFLVLTSLLTLAKWSNLHKKHLIQGFWLMAFAIQTLGIVLSGSITAYLGLLTGTFILFLASKQIRKKILLVSLPTLLIVGMAFTILFILGSPITRQVNLGDNVVVQSLNRVEDITAQSRTVIYQQALNEAMMSPFIGVGYDQISTSGIDTDSRILTTSVHNFFLQVFYAGGIFSLLGWVFIFLYLGWHALKILLNKKINEILILSLCAIVFAILLMDQFQDSIYPREKWLVVALFTSAYLNLYSEKPKKVTS